MYIHIITCDLYTPRPVCHCLLVPGLLEVVEIISLYQADRLCRSAMNVVESMRLALAVLVCPSRYAPESVRAELPGSLRLREHTEGC